jgi:Arc/MetJ-type ribon-helix-helix transcriptional regulator
MSEERVDSIDALVASGAYPSRAGFIVAAIDRLFDALEREAVDRAIVEGYRRIPPTGTEARWAEVSSRESVATEPW